jgi:hypothetical protein
LFISQWSRCPQELFELAVDIEDQLCDLSEALEKISATISKLTKLYPQSLQWGD